MYGSTLIHRRRVRRDTVCVVFKNNLHRRRRVAVKTNTCHGEVTLTRAPSYLFSTTQLTQRYDILLFGSNRLGHVTALSSLSPLLSVSSPLSPLLAGLHIMEREWTESGLRKSMNWRFIEVICFLFIWDHITVQSSRQDPLVTEQHVTKQYDWLISDRGPFHHSRSYLSFVERFRQGFTTRYKIYRWVHSKPVHRLHTHWLFKRLSFWLFLQGWNFVSKNQHCWHFKLIKCVYIHTYSLSQCCKLLVLYKYIYIISALSALHVSLKSIFPFFFQTNLSSLKEKKRVSTEQKI